MNPALRAKAMLLDPADEWPRIAQETGDPAYVLSHYVAVLALVPALFGFVGASLIGGVTSSGETVRASLFNGLFGAIFAYASAFVIVLVLGFVINVMAPLFGARKNFADAFKVAVYSFTPMWLTGIFLLLPGLRFLALTGFYGVYVLAVGLPQLMKTPEQKTPAYAVAIVACACALIYASAAVQRTLFGVHIP